MAEFLNTEPNTSVSGASEADNFSNSGDSVTIDAGEGDDTIENGGASVSISGGGGDDSIKNNGEKVTISAGAGNDFVDNNNDNVSVSGGEGNDSIDNIGSNVMILSEAGNDYTSNNGSNVTIDAGEGDDTIDNSGSNVSISSGNGDDSINNSGDNVTISGGAGADSITNSGSNVTISAGEGNDFIDNNNGSNVVFRYTGGNDTIYGFGETSSLQVSNISDATMNSSGATLQIGNNNLTLADYTGTNEINTLNSDPYTIPLFVGTSAAGEVIVNNDYSKITIRALVGNDTISNTVEEVTIDAGDGNDSIENSEANVLINGEAGADSIKNTAANVSISGGADDDSIYNSGSTVSIAGGDGNDYIDNYVSNVTISAGAGNDTIYSSNASKVVFQYTGGNDTIYGFDTTSSLQFLQGSIVASTMGSSGATLQIGSNTLTLVDYTGTNQVNVANSDPYAIPLFAATAEDTLIANDISGIEIEGATSGDDNITNSADSVTINAEAGNDYIDNRGSNVSISGGAGDDTVTNIGNAVSISGGAGADEIFNDGSKVLIDAGTGDDYIENSGSNVTIMGGTGADSVYNDGGENVLFVYNSTDGADSIAGFNTTSSLKVNNTISSAYYDVAGNIILKLGGGTASLTIVDYKEANTINVIDNSGKLSMYTINELQGTAGDDEILSSLSGITISGLAGNDDIENSAMNVTIDGGAGNDDIGNNAVNVSINGNAGDDTITNSGSQVTVNGGEGDDTITNEGVSAILLGDAGKDSIKNISDFVSIDAGAGDDSIINSGDNVTISAGAGNDFIENTAASANVLFEYTGGNDTISGFDATSSLKVNNTISSAYFDGENNAIFKISGNTNSSLTIADFSDTNTLNVIVGNKAASVYTIKEMQGTAGADTLENVVSGITVKGLGGNDNIENSAATVTIDGGAGNDYINNIATATGVSIGGGAGADSIYNYADSVTIDGGADKDSIYNIGDFVTINGGVENDSIENSGTTVSIAGGAGADEINNSADDVTISAGEGNDTIESFGAKNVLFQYTSGNDIINGFNQTSSLQINNTISSGYINEDGNAVLKIGSGYLTITSFKDTNQINVIVKGKDSIYTISEMHGSNEQDSLTNSISGGMKISGLAEDDIINNTGDSITIDGGAGNDLIINSGKAVSISGNDGSDTIDNDGDNVTITSGKGDDSIANIGNNVTISGDDGSDTIDNDGASVSINGGAGNDFIELSGGDSATVNVNAGNDTISVGLAIKNFKVENFSTGDVIQLSTAAEKLESISGGVSVGELTIEGLTLSNTTASLRSLGRTFAYIQSHTKGATLSEDNLSIVYTAAGTETLFSISGVKNADGLIVDKYNKMVTVTAAALNKTNVTINNDYTLMLDDDVPTSDLTGSWYLSGTSAIYKIEGGYELDADGITYVAPTTGDGALLELSGISISEDSEPIFTDDVLTLYEDNFAGNVSVISNGGSFAFNVEVGGYSGKIFAANDFDDTISNSGSDIEILGGAGNDYIYNYTGSENTTIDAGDGDDTIDNQTENALLIGGAGDDSICNYGNSATINPGTGNDTLLLNVAGGDKNVIQYAAGDGNDVITLPGTGEGATIAVELAESILGGYSYYATEEDENNPDLILSIENSSITFKNADNALISLRTATGENYIWNGTAAVSIEASDGNDFIENKSYSVTINSGKGNDTVVLNATPSLSAGGNVFVYGAGDGNDVIRNFMETDAIKIDGNLKVTPGVKGNDVILSVGNAGKIALKNTASENMQITLLDSDDNIISADTYTKSGVIADYGTIELWSTFAGTYTAEDAISTVDGSKATGRLRIVGNSEMTTNSLLGGAAGDTLIGIADSSDTLTGGKGKDVFIYNGGFDVITDFEAKERISIGGGLSYLDFDVDSDRNVILNFEGGNSLTINEGENKAIQLLEGKNKTTNFFMAEGLFNSVKSSATLNGTYESFDANIYSKLTTIDGSQANVGEIIGNKRSNIITASEIGSTILGGKGKDTLIGGAGADIFVHERTFGKDIIYNYDEFDRVSLGSDATIKNAMMDKTAAVIKIANGHVKVLDTSEVTLTAEGNDTIFRDGVLVDQSNATAKVFAGFKGTINLEDFSDLNVTALDASVFRKKLTVSGSSGDDSVVGGSGKDSLIGGDGNDYIEGGKGADVLTGGNGDDTLRGGRGNDTLWGGEGSDTFIFRALDGNDTIKDFDSTLDSLIILDRYGEEISFSKSTFRNGTLTLVVNGGGKIILEGVGASSNFNISNKIYNLSGGRLVE